MSLNSFKKGEEAFDMNIIIVDSSDAVQLLLQSSSSWDTESCTLIPVIITSSDLILVNQVRMKLNATLSIQESLGYLNHTISIYSGEGVGENYYNNNKDNNKDNIGVEEFYSDSDFIWMFDDVNSLGLVSFYHNLRSPSIFQWNVRGDTAYANSSISISVSDEDEDGHELYSSHILGGYETSPCDESWYVFD